MGACLISIPLDLLALQVDHTAFDTPANYTQNECVSCIVREMLIGNFGLQIIKGFGVRVASG